MDKKDELKPSNAWLFEQGMLKASKQPNSTKAAYLVVRWCQMVYSAIGEAKSWLPEFDKTQSEDNEMARSLLEGFISKADVFTKELEEIEKKYDEYKKEK